MYNGNMTAFKQKGLDEFQKFELDSGDGRFEVNCS